MTRWRGDEGCEAEPYLAWDTVWVERADGSGGFGDWIMAGPGDAPESQGGLRAAAALHTATLLCLFSDRRLPDGVDPPTGDDDRRGWWGNSIRLDGEPDVEMGSLLWTLQRAALTADVARRAESYAAEALATLAAHGAVARTDVVCTIDRPRRALLLAVTHWARSGSRLYEQRFGVLWTNAALTAPMTVGLL